MIASKYCYSLRECVTLTNVIDEIDSLRTSTGPRDMVFERFPCCVLVLQNAVLSVCIVRPEFCISALRPNSTIFNVRFFVIGDVLPSVNDTRLQ